MRPEDKFEAAKEAFRRRAQLGPTSTAALSTGVANLSPQAQTPQQILTQRVSPNQAPNLPASMSSEGINQLRESRPNEAQIIVRALIQRLRSLTPQPAQV